MFSSLQSGWFQRILLRLLLTFFATSLFFVVVFRFLPVPLTPLMLIRSISSVFQGEIVGIHRDWVSIDEISPSIQRAVLKAEDDRFYEHNGFNFEAIEKAFEYNKTHKRMKGASTISQQTAKNLFLWPGRSWLRKGLEVYFTVLLEAAWSKERILEVYLNIIEVAPGVYGAEAASQKFFGRKAKDLSATQAALIAAVLPNPRKFRIDRPSSYVLSRQRRIMKRPAPVINSDSSS